MDFSKSIRPFYFTQKEDKNLVITSSDIGMRSSRTYAKTSGERFSFSSNAGQSKMDSLLRQLSTGRTEKTSALSDSGMSARRKLRYYSMNYLWSFLFGDKYRLTDPYANGMQNLFGGFGGFGGTFSQESFTYEEETTSFETMGTVRTSDGREIDFNLSLTMSRSFMESYSQTFSLPQQFTDPLVINLDCDAADVSDQKFYFDLDADGHEEAISMLGSGSGFLALDRNHDGKINDGSELFGAKSGNGFADLVAYDQDGNGWIDENDDVFSDLLIWTKDRDGNDKLVGLGEAGVGAIYLGSAPTEFSMNNLMTNDANARIRSTGFFLYEHGGMGTMQQVDFAS